MLTQALKGFHEASLRDAKVERTAFSTDVESLRDKERIAFRMLLNFLPAIQTTQLRTLVPLLIKPS